MGTYELEKKVQLYIEKNRMIQSGDRILVGVSGGADSVCLLMILKELSEKLDFSLYVLHVHHGVRAEADTDAWYVEKLCQSLDIPFYLEKVSMLAYARKNKLSEEEAGRVLRYELFAKYREKLNCQHVAVAHHGNDRAETMLFNLFRGSGLQGLTSIRPVRDEIIRPLLCLTRDEIEGYLQEKHMLYCEDITNLSDEYTRNKIRHNVIPYAEKEICEQAVSHMSETAEQLMEIQSYLERETWKAFKDCVQPAKSEEVLDRHLTKVCIELSRFGTYDIVLQKRILLLCLEKLTPHRKDITSAHIAGILNLLQAEGTASIQLPYKLEARKQYDVLYLGERQDKEREKGAEIVLLDKGDACRASDEQETMVECFLEDLGLLKLWLIEDCDEVASLRQNIPKNQYTKCFDYDKISSAVVVRTRRVGDYIICDKDAHQKSIKEYMINEKIPSHERDYMWLLAEGSHVLWIPGYRISEYYKIDKNTKRILKVQIQEENHA